ncbi:MAG: endonuclease [Saprospiraceae bacterium]|nr:MAG: endonuclease [Saprospiraceae bacterium]
MTYNIRYDNPGDGVHNWDHRKEHVVALLDFHEPDVLGIQEGLHHQVTYLDEALPHMKYVGIGRDDGHQKGEYTAIFYNSDRFELVMDSTFWLSPNPDRPSVGWDASMERICTYALLQERNPTNGTKRRFWVLNAHLDHRGPESRLQALKLIWETIEQLNKSVTLPVILMGDFNAEPQEDPITFISQQMNDSRSASIKPAYGPEGTFTGFVYKVSPKRRIDYIFTNVEFRVNKYAVIGDTYDNFYPSDHLPILVELAWK